jgi:hypothetical protein
MARSLFCLQGRFFVDICSRCGKTLERGHHWLVVAPFVVIHMACKRLGDVVVRGGHWS